MAKGPVLFDPEKPLAHYERAGRLYKKVKKSLSFGIVMPAAAFFCGAACILYDPMLMAVFALFAVPFTLLSVIGCKTRRAVPCLISIPLALAAAVTALVSGEPAASLGFAACLISAFAEFKAMYAIKDFYALKKLPGFPFFDHALDGISFAALDRRDADEFVEGELVEEKTMKRFSPEELVPSQNMEEIVTGVSLKKEGGNTPPPEAAEVIAVPKEAGEEENESPYERMVRISGGKRNDISDVELFE